MSRSKSGERVVSLAYADNITVIVKNLNELNKVNVHLKIYKEVSGAKLNHEKTEGVWFGREDNQPNINIQTKNTIKTQGEHLNNRDNYRENWENKK